jgi:hypothetical protein
MPKFIYTLAIVILLLSGTSLYVMSTLDPEFFISKIIFTLLFFLTILLGIPLIKCLFNIYRKNTLDLGNKYKSDVKNNILNSTIFSLMLFLKLFKLFSLSTFLILIIIFVVTNKAFTKLKKSRKRRIY